MEIRGTGPIQLPEQQTLARRMVQAAPDTTGSLKAPKLDEPVGDSNRTIHKTGPLSMSQIDLEALGARVRDALRPAAAEESAVEGAMPDMDDSSEDHVMPNKAMRPKASGGGMIDFGNLDP